jgi:ABC-type sugar transport system ATPase subunit
VTEVSAESPNNTTSANGTVAAARPPLLRIENLSKTFVGQKALDRVSLEIAQGEVHALLGQNGCGKSTLIKVLTGYHQPDAGVRVWLGGKEAHLAHGRLVAEDGEQIEIRAVHQDLGLVDRLNSVDNIGLVIGFKSAAGGKIGWREQARRTRELLARVGASDLDIWRPLDQCDKLHRTQVAIARVLATWESDRGLVVLDEPTASLQALQVERLFEVIDDIRQSGISVLYVSHRLGEIFQIADRLTVLREGRLIGSRDVAEVDHEGLISMMLGSTDALEADAATVAAEAAVSATPAAQRPVRLRVEGLTSRELAGLDFAVHEGEILGFAGVVGSGQEELPYLLVGSHKAAAGTLRIGEDEHDLSRMSPRRAKALGLGLVPAERATQALIKELSVSENITLPTVSGFERGGLLRRRDEEAFAHQWGERLELAPNSPQKVVGLFSGGNQQKIVLGKAMSVGETALILAEPTAGVDIGAKALIYNYLRREAAAGTVMIICSSDVTDLIELCTRVIALRNGEIVGELQREAITEDAVTRSILASKKESV